MPIIRCMPKPTNQTALPTFGGDPPSMLPSIAAMSILGVPIIGASIVIMVINNVPAIAPAIALPILNVFIGSFPSKQHHRAELDKRLEFLWFSKTKTPDMNVVSLLSLIR
jgi:hypothetical protein